MTKNSELLCPDVKEQSDADTVLFVCTGNTCRSPMAEALFNHLYANDTRCAASAGLFATGEPISKNAVSALMERGVLPTAKNDYRSHVSQSVNENILENAALVVAMTSSHAMQLIMRYPAYASKVAVMPKDITDPFGGDEEDYRRCLADIEEALKEAFAPAGEEETK